MPQLFLALEGRIEFIKKTNPFAAPEKKPVDPKKLHESRALLDELNIKAREKLKRIKGNG